MRRLVWLLAAGCGGPAVATAEATSGSAATEAGLSTSTWHSASTSASGDTGVSSIGYLDGWDFGHGGDVCDPVTQDCDEGSKCAFVSIGLEQPNYWRCVAVSADPQPLGAPCQSAGLWTGVDDCDVGLVCWDVDPDGDGTCRAYCTGSVAAPICERPDEVCEHHDEVGLCVPRCDPNAAAPCPVGETCQAQPRGFSCEP